MNKYTVMRTVVFLLLFIFFVLAISPYLYRAEKKILKEDIVCINAICVNEGDIENCSQVPSQIAHYAFIKNDIVSKKFVIELTGKECR